jgi:hypothetical protein
MGRCRTHSRSFGRITSDISAVYERTVQTVGLTFISLQDLGGKLQTCRDRPVFNLTGHSSGGPVKILSTMPVRYHTVCSDTLFCRKEVLIILVVRGSQMGRQNPPMMALRINSPRWRPHSSELLRGSSGDSCGA